MAPTTTDLHRRENHGINFIQIGKQELCGLELTVAGLQRRVLSAAFCPKENKAGIKGSPCSAPLGLADEVVVSVVVTPKVL